MHWRSIDRDDLPALVDLAGACFSADGGLHFLFDPDSLAERYFPDASGHAIGAFAADGQLVACTSVYLGASSGAPRVVIVGQVHPELRRRGLGHFLMRWSQRQAEALLAPVRLDGRLLQIRTESLTPSADRLYREHGFEQVDEQLVMRRHSRLPLPDCPFPSGVTIKTWQPGLADQFFQAYDTAFKERPGFPGYTSAEWLESWTTDNFVPEWSLLALSGAVPLGFLTATSEPPHGFVMQVGVVPMQRRRGLGSALIVEAMRRMIAAGVTSIQLTVRIDNPGAIQAYLNLGFETIGRRARYEKPTLLAGDPGS